MKTAVEWLVDEMLKQGYFDANKQLTFTNLDNLQHQAKEMENKQQDELAIGFADWMICKVEKYTSYLYLIKDYKELLEIYKKQL
jgi:hypothetical protein